MHSTTHDIPIPSGSLRVRVADCPGIPAILVHGGPGGTDYLFKFFAKPLKDLGYRPVGYIQRGSPGSPSTGPYTVPAHIGDLEAVRQFLEAGQVALVGHSWGGLLSTCYAAIHPERVSRLTIICPIGPRNGWQETMNATMRERFSSAERDEYDRLEREARAATSEAERSRLMVQRAGIQVMTYYAPKHREGKPGLAQLTWPVREQTLKSVDEWYTQPDWELGLERLDCPSGLIHGLEDVIPESVVDDFRQILPDLRVVGLEDCGHFPWFEEKDVFFEAFAELMK